MNLSMKLAIEKLKEQANNLQEKEWTYCLHAGSDDDQNSDWDIKTETGRVVCSEPQSSYDKIAQQNCGPYIGAASPQVIQELFRLIEANQKNLNHSQERLIDLAHALTSINLLLRKAQNGLSNQDIDFVQKMLENALLHTKTAFVENALLKQGHV